MIGAACAAAVGAGAAAEGRDADPAIEAIARVEKERRAKEEYFRNHPWSPARAFKRYDLPRDSAPIVIVGSAASADVRVEGDGMAGRQLAIELLPAAGDGSARRFRAENLGPDASVRIEGEPLAGGGSAGAARVISQSEVIEIGPYAVRAYVQDGAGILILFDSRLTAPDRFEPPRYFDIDPAWYFRAPLVRHTDPEVLPLGTSLGRIKKYRRIGHFDLTNGESAIRVYAYEPTFVAHTEEMLMILFTDATSGTETYGAGRYLDLDAPRDGLYTIDFNRAYNPYCSYTSVYNCPIPPSENRLEVAVRAGEKDYPH